MGGGTPDTPLSLKGEGFRSFQRLKTPADFTYLKDRSKSFRTKTFFCFYKASRFSLPFARLGLSVSRKTGNAIRRNRLKRLCREFFRCSEIRHFSLDMLIVVSPKIDFKSRPEEAERLLKEQLKIFERKILKDEKDTTE